MSASLVGSEMCIRDRFLARKCQQPGWLCGPSQPCLLRPASFSSRKCRPVSYTHLTLPTICSV
eukprot:8670521-Alexandrium_andersonii.AAC.1